MKIIRNEAKIRRYGQLGGWLTLAALLVLGAGFYISFAQPNLFLYSLLSLMIGFVLMQISLFLGNRYGRRPRLDERLDTSLKGLSNEYSLYHFSGPVPHLLVGPAGLWVLRPYHQAGKIRYQRNRWQISGGGFMQAYMRLFGQEGIGRPEAEVDAELDSLRNFLRKNVDAETEFDPQAVLVFNSEGTDLSETQSAPIPAVTYKQLKDLIRKSAKSRPLTPAQLAEIKAALPNDEAS